MKKDEAVGYIRALEECRKYIYDTLTERITIIAESKNINLSEIMK